MRTLTSLCLATLLAAIQPAAAQIACPNIPVPRHGPPVLHLSESAIVKVARSVLVADVTATAPATTAVPTQRAVNTLMARAKALADKTPGVAAIFQDYSTQYVGAEPHKPARWIASQTLELKGHSSEAVLDLVGRLQVIGLTINDLGWQMPAEEAEATRRTAAIKALTVLRNEASAAATALGLVVQGYRSVDLSGGPFPVPIAHGGMAGMAMAAAMPASQASAASQGVTARVSATVILGPMPTTRPMLVHP